MPDGDISRTKLQSNFLLRYKDPHRVLDDWYDFHKEAAATQMKAVRDSCKVTKRTCAEDTMELYLLHKGREEEYEDALLILDKGTVESRKLGCKASTVTCIEVALTQYLFYKKRMDDWDDILAAFDKKGDLSE